MKRNPFELMRLHVEALYTYDNRERLLAVNDWGGGTAPRFFLGRTSAGNLWRFRADVPDAVVAELEEYCRAEPVVEDLTQAPQYEAIYLKLLADHAPIETVSTGPAYWLPAPSTAPAEQSLALDASTAHLLRGGLEDWIPDVPHQRPFHVAVADEHAVAVCASVRITAAAHAAGVETLPAYRRQGHALTAVAGWARAVAALGALPFYSTSWENVASQGVAARLGARLIGADFHIT